MKPLFTNSEDPNVIAWREPREFRRRVATLLIGIVVILPILAILAFSRTW
jgi:hypothetical protein